MRIWIWVWIWIHVWIGVRPHVGLHLDLGLDFGSGLGPGFGSTSGFAFGAGFRSSSGPTSESGTRILWKGWRWHVRPPALRASHGSPSGYTEHRRATGRSPPKGAAGFPCPSQLGEPRGKSGVRSSRGRSPGLRAEGRDKMAAVLLALAVAQRCVWG